ncbi:MAG: hypothetical protein RLZZ479_1028 [Bacteroidota bacterium]|jgi:2-phospho-L-lactate transferase/gluconeogenesis factor (CofD/UPF0052 family)
MKIVMFCGGRGATTITESLLRQTNAEVTLIINCYDNGLSTGRIRKYIDGLLGPSDFRKNLTTLLTGLGQKHLADFLEFRIPNLDRSYDSLEKELTNLFDLNLNYVRAKQWNNIRKSIETFESYNRTSGKIFDFKDCAIGNLVVAGSFLENNKNLNQTFATLCSNIIGEDAKYRILNATDGSNLYLYAKSLDRKWILSEEEIVDNPDGLRISQVFLAQSPIKDDSEANDKYKRVLPNPNPEALRAIQLADVIIYGPGTPSSSLLPTYLTSGIAQAIESNKNAIKLFISNIKPDRDDPEGNILSRIDGTILHLNQYKESKFGNLINTAFLNPNDEKYIPEILNLSNNIQFVHDEWLDTNGKHFGTAVVRQLDKLVNSQLKLKPGFVSVVIPILNEVNTIEKTLVILKKELSKINYSYEILLVDGGSEDGTLEVVDKIRGDDVQLLASRYKGRGGACRTGIEKSKGDVIGILHADLEYSIAGFIKCLELNLSGQSRATIGIRVSKTKNLRSQIRNVYVNQKVLGTLSYWGSIAVSTIGLIKMHRFFLDPLSGIKIFDKNIIESSNFSRNGLDFEIELLQKLTKSEIEILEIPIDYTPRNKKNGKKTNILKGLQALWYLGFMRRN